MKQTTVLVVEDEALIRLDIVEQLEKLGYIVHEAENADNAIAFLERSDDIRLVFTDVQMPGCMDGLQLAHFVRKRWPPTAIVICSAIKKPSTDELPAHTYWLAKPAMPDSVLKAVETAKRWITPDPS
jgi:CheY-like chemotaxis protein